VSKKR